MSAVRGECFWCGGDFVGGVVVHVPALLWVSDGGYVDGWFDGGFWYVGVLWK